MTTTTGPEPLRAAEGSESPPETVEAVSEPRSAADEAFRAAVLPVLDRAGHLLAGLGSEYRGLAARAGSDPTARRLVEHVSAEALRVAAGGVTTTSAGAVSVEDALARDTSGGDLLPGVFPRTGVGGWFGASGSGKTLAIVARNVALATDLAWLGHRVDETAGSLYVALEDRAGAPRRFAAFAKRRAVELDGCFVLTDADVNAGSASSVEALLPLIEDAATQLDRRGFRLGVVTLDTVAWMLGGLSANDGSGSQAVAGLLSRIGREFGVLAEGVAHTPHATSERQAGHHSARAAQDVAIAVGERTIRLDKSRDHEPRDLGHFGIEAETITLPGVPVRTRAVPVLTEVGAIEAALAATADDPSEAEDAERRARNERTSVEVLRIVEGEPPASGMGKTVPPGWSDTAVNAALDALSTRPTAQGGPVDVHVGRRHTRPVLDGLAEGGLISDLNGRHKSGRARAWALTEDGRRVLSEHDAASREDT